MKEDRGVDVDSKNCGRWRRCLIIHNKCETTCLMRVQNRRVYCVKKKLNTKAAEASYLRLVNNRASNNNKVSLHRRCSADSWTRVTQIFFCFSNHPSIRPFIGQNVSTMQTSEHLRCFWRSMAILLDRFFFFFFLYFLSTVAILMESHPEIAMCPMHVRVAAKVTNGIKGFWSWWSIFNP